MRALLARAAARPSGPARVRLRVADARRALETGLDYCELDSPFGRAVIGFTPLGVCHLSFADDPAAAAARLRAAWSGVTLRARPEQADAWRARLFGPRPAEAVPVWVDAEGFRLGVWRALARLPRGLVWSYAELARRAGSPRAARAVGSAMAANPVPWLIPCHCVIHADGRLGEYGGGRARKARMLAWELSR